MDRVYKLRLRYGKWYLIYSDKEHEDQGPFAWENRYKYIRKAEQRGYLKES